MQIVINRSCGPFELSYKALKLYGKLKQIKDIETIDDVKIKRTDPILIQIVKKLGTEASGPCSFLKIVNIPNNIEWWIYETESGLETIHEKHRVWL